MKTILRLPGAASYPWVKGSYSYGNWWLAGKGYRLSETKLLHPAVVFPRQPKFRPMHDPAFPAPSSSVPAILAVDGGGTKTAAVRIGQDASVQAYQTTGGSNPFDQSGWQEVLTDLVTPMSEGVLAFAFGLAGYGENRAFGETIRTHLHSLCPNGVFTLSNDVDMACNGAFAEGAGVLLLSGTGAIAWARNALGQTTRVGGWGSTFGDEGSAYWIGRKALQLLCQAFDGRAPDAVPFARRLCAHMGWADTNPAAMDALLGWHAAQARPRSAVAQCARLVDTLAEEGCPQALALLKAAAVELARCVQTARAHFEPDTVGMAPLPWSYAGSVFNSGLIRTELTTLCGTPQPPRLPPLGGGILRAARQAGWRIDSDWISTLAENLQTLPATSTPPTTHPLPARQADKAGS